MGVHEHGDVHDHHVVTLAASGELSDDPTLHVWHRLVLGLELS